MAFFAILERVGKQNQLWPGIALCFALLIAASLTHAQEPPSQPAAQPAPALTTVHGIVRNAVTGAPLPRALVRIEGDAETGALTDGEGRFELPGVPVGPEIIRVRKPGFQDRPYATEDVGYQGDGPAHSVLVAAEMPNLIFTLTPSSAIHGHIELSTGDPAEGIQITLLKQVIRNGRSVWTRNGMTKSNGEGAYRFAGLPAGVYALFTEPSLESEPTATALAPGARVALNGYATVFYPQARDFAGATRIQLKAGEQAEANLLLTLEPFYPVKATAILPNGKPLGEAGASGNPGDFVSPSMHILVTVLDAAGHPLEYKAQYDSRTHSILASLPENLYTFLVVATFDESSGNSPGTSPGSSRRKPEGFWGYAEFSVDRQAAAKLQIPLSPQAKWTIHLRATRMAPQTFVHANQGLKYLVSVAAYDANDASVGNAGTEMENPDPDLLEMNLAPYGHYWLSTQLNDRSLCVDSFSAGGVNLAREPLSVALGSSPPQMEISLIDNCAKLALTLPPALAEFLPGDEPFYTVYVVPDFETTTDIPPMTLHPSSGATLTVDGLTPGSYHVYIFNEPIRLEYRNPAVLAALPNPGQPVTLSAGSATNLLLEVPGR